MFFITKRPQILYRLYHDIKKYVNFFYYCMILLFRLRFVMYDLYIIYVYCIINNKSLLDFSTLIVATFYRLPITFDNVYGKNKITK